MTACCVHVACAGSDELTRRSDTEQLADSAVAWWAMEDFNLRLGSYELPVLSSELMALIKCLSIPGCQPTDKLDLYEKWRCLAMPSQMVAAYGFEP